jgi:GT2 family glycosyltransferase
MSSSQHKNRPPISIVIPSYNGQHLLATHLPQVIKVMTDQDELIVIDDCSTDNTEVWFREWRQKIHRKTVYIQNISNLRFGGAVNKAVSMVSNHYFLLLNNDVSPHLDLLDILWNYWQTQANPENTFAVGCKELEHNIKLDRNKEPKQKTQPDTRSKADGSGNPNHPQELVVSGRNLLWFERGMFIHSRHAQMVSGETAWASGGSSLFSKEKWQKIGGFDRKFYPAYWEDIDLSMRAKNNQWQVLFCEDAVVDHLHETTNSSVFGKRKIELMSWRNAYIFAWKHMTKTQWISHIIWMGYHLTLTSLRTRGLPILALIQAIIVFLDNTPQKPLKVII